MFFFLLVTRRRVGWLMIVLGWLVGWFCSGCILWLCIFIWVENWTVEMVYVIIVGFQSSSRSKHVMLQTAHSKRRAVTVEAPQFPVHPVFPSPLTFWSVPFGRELYSDVSWNEHRGLRCASICSENLDLVSTSWQSVTPCTKSTGHPIEQVLVPNLWNVLSGKVSLDNGRMRTSTKDLGEQTESGTSLRLLLHTWIPLTLQNQSTSQFPRIYELYRDLH
jgi:hypothetical protein